MPDPPPKKMLTCHSMLRSNSLHQSGHILQAVNVSHMTKQKIVFLHPDLGIGGAERLVIDAAMELSRFGYEARVISRLQSLLT